MDMDMENITVIEFYDGNVKMFRFPTENNNNAKILVELKTGSSYELGQTNYDNNVINVESGLLIINGLELKKGQKTIIPKGKKITVNAIEHSTYIMETNDYYK